MHHSERIATAIDTDTPMANDNSNTMVSPDTTTDTPMANTEEVVTPPNPPPSSSSSQEHHSRSSQGNTQSEEAKKPQFVKRHRVRSRSMPNLIFYDSRIHKPQPPQKRHDFVINPKYLSTSTLPTPSCTPARDQPCSISPLSPAPPTAAHHAAAAAKRHKKRRTSPSPSLSALPPTPAAPIQPPPVNAQSLREIDLQEIFKNPQLRHDIIFDPQLQFRPNLDGERGKRKRMVADRYWDAVVAEFEFVAAQPAGVEADLMPNSKLPLLFHTLREILLSLLPVKDRVYVDSVLDPELLVQQLRHAALDFAALAHWLSGVFKAHCAPMRDAWVDQMVSRVELGVETRSPRRLVDGIRLVFAILEAMKLDVANHQIRTLRPMLVDTAVEFEQDYYTQVIDKGKMSLQDSLEWFKNGLGKYSAQFTAEQHGVDTNRAALVYSLLRLLSCSAEDIVADFPTTFGFDFSRLAGFRAELRKVVCLHLCVLLYQQMVQSHAKTVAPSKARLAMASCLGGETVAKLKQDLLAIIEDSLGNSKWTKNTQALALEITKRVRGAFHGPEDTIDQTMVDTCLGWLSKHLQPRSDLYKLLETKTTNGLLQILCKSMSVLSPLDSTTTCSTTCPTPAPGTASPVYKEMLQLADRVLVLVRFHWGVFGKFYVAYVSSLQVENGDEEEDAAIQQSTACVLPSSRNPSSQLKKDESGREITQIRQSSTSAC
ncbi:hypothetical protein TRVA0_008S03202 [Trichomonascus vanleenenianus]|uniref:Sok1p n=1 Tax=Trichomonascus vanleenenianus TaxID=2268995 RepID=UPI003EC9BA8F